MPKAFWKGVISFGLVAIPVKMYVGTESKPLSFHLLHKKCLTRPKQVLHCETDNEYFSVKDTVRGYEVTKDQFVVLEDSDFEKVPIKTSHSIDIHGFIEAGEIDPIYYYGCHFIEPEELGAKPFQLLREALLKTGRARHRQGLFPTPRAPRPAQAVREYTGAAHHPLSKRDSSTRGTKSPRFESKQGRA